jgi:hypothetical protein
MDKILFDYSKNNLENKIMFSRLKEIEKSLYVTLPQMHITKNNFDNTKEDFTKKILYSRSKESEIITKYSMNIKNDVA